MRFKNVYHRSMKHADKSIFYTSNFTLSLFILNPINPKDTLNPIYPKPYIP